MSWKSPAQILFDRIFRTWIIPEVERRRESSANMGPIPLRLALLIWVASDNPDVYLNTEVFGKVDSLKILAAGRIERNQEIAPENIGGLDRTKLARPYWEKPFMFICQGRDQYYYVTFENLGALQDARDFDAAKTALAQEGVRLTVGDTDVEIYLDLFRNSYSGSPSEKRQKTEKFKKIKIEEFSKTAIARVKRHMKLPTFVMQRDDEVLPLLLEARETYINGYFFACIAASTTAADRICNGLLDIYGIDKHTKKSILKRTFGQKLPQLRSLGLISDAQEAFLETLNKIRNKHLHPKRTITSISTKRDALQSIQLLHQFLEGTLSVFRDYQIENGKLMPRPLT